MPLEVMEVERAYEKDKNLRREDIEAFEEWMRKQPHLPEATELQLLLFLHSCYYRLEAAKSCIDNFFTVRTLCPEIFATPTAEVFERASSVGSVNILPKKTPEGYSVVLMKLIDPNPEHYHNIDQINLVDLTMTLNLHQHGTSEGVLVVIDMEGIAFGHLARFNLTATRKYLFYVQEAAPLRIRGIHHVNVVPFADKLVALAKPFMKRELVQLLKFHDSMESLYQFIPKEVLPRDYGGEAPPLSTLHEQNRRNIRENMEFFRWLDTLRVDESKRLGKPKNVGDMFGIDGTFKRLEVD